MKNINKFAFVLALLVAFSLLSFGQATFTTTTLTAATGPNTTTFPLASVTGVNAPNGPQGIRTMLYIDKAAYYVQSINGLNVSVVRGVRGTYGLMSHLNGALVWVGPDDPAHFSGTATSPSPSLRGGCTATQQSVLPVIEVYTGFAWNCWGVVNRWATVNPSSGNNQGAYAGTVASVAGALTIPGTFFTISGTNAITGFTLPVGFAAGSCLTIVPSGIFTTTTAGNISVATTAVVGKTLLECYDGTRFNPSY